MLGKVKTLYYKGTDNFIAFFLEGEKQEKYILFGKISGFTMEETSLPLKIDMLQANMPSFLIEHAIELKTNFIKSTMHNNLFWMIKIKDSQEFESMYKILECVWE